MVFGTWTIYGLDMSPEIQLQIKAESAMDEQLYLSF